MKARELPVAKAIAGVDMRLQPSAMRAMHWYPTSDEWQYDIEGEARKTVFASGGRAGTFNYRTCDVGSRP